MTAATTVVDTSSVTVGEQAPSADVLSLRLWKSGNMRGYNELVQRYEKPLFHFIYCMVRDADESKDILQDTFVRLYQSLARLREDKSLKAWLYQTANNLCIDHFRKHKPGRVTTMDHTDSLFEAIVDSGEPDHELQPDLILHNKQLKESILKGINQLPKQQRMMMNLRSCKGLSLKEIAEVMDCNERTVGTTLFAARKRLVDLLKPVLAEVYGPGVIEELS